jgi:transposase
MEGFTEDITNYKVRYKQLHVKYDTLLHELAQLKKMFFGSRQERFTPNDDKKPNPQLSLGLDIDTIAECKITATTQITYTRTKTEIKQNNPKPHPGRMALADHLRRITIILQPDIDVSGLKKIGDEVTEILEYIPGEWIVKQYIRAKYELPTGTNTSTIITASLPGRMMEKCMAAEGLLTQIMVDKYVDHIPLHRPSQRAERAGVILAQSTMNGWARDTLDHMTAIYLSHKQLVLSCNYLHADETPLKVLDNTKKGTTHQGYYWVYHNSKDKLVLFDYRPGRGREGPDDMLKDFQGYLQTDGYSAYNDFDKRTGISLLHCMAHARRKYHEALQSDKARAEYALTLFGKLYAIERRIKQEALTAEAVVQLRQSEAIPVLNSLQSWMTREYPKVLPKSPIGKAIAYCLPRWEKLNIYTTDSILSIYNNQIENAIRPVAIGKKNYLFPGSHDAAQRAAMIYSLFATCKMHSINPYTWLKDVLERMHLYTTSNIAELLPQNWKKAQA